MWMQVFLLRWPIENHKETSHMSPSLNKAFTYFYLVNIITLFWSFLLSLSRPLAPLSLPLSLSIFSRLCLSLLSHSLHCFSRPLSLPCSLLSFLHSPPTLCLPTLFHTLCLPHLSLGVDGATACLMSVLSRHTLWRQDTCIKCVTWSSSHTQPV